MVNASRFRFIFITRLFQHVIGMGYGVHLNESTIVLEVFGISYLILKGRQEEADENVLHP